MYGILNCEKHGLPLQNKSSHAPLILLTAGYVERQIRETSAP